MEQERGSTLVDIGQAVRRARLANGIKQSDLASHLDISFQMMQKYERGVSPIPADRLAKICQLVGIASEELLQLPKGRKISASVQKVYAATIEEEALLAKFRALPNAYARGLILNLLDLVNEDKGQSNSPTSRRTLKKS